MNRVRLRAIEDGDIALFFTQQNEPEACAMAAWKPRSEHAFRTHWTKLLINPKVVNRTIVVGEPAKVAGYAASFERDGLREVCYWLGKDYWGKGIATDALKQLLEIVTERPLHARVIVGGAASRKVLEKCGFKVIRRERFSNSAGELEEDVLRLD